MAGWVHARILRTARSARLGSNSGNRSPPHRMDGAGPALSVATRIERVPTAPPPGQQPPPIAGLATGLVPTRSRIWNQSGVSGDANLFQSLDGIKQVSLIRAGLSTKLLALAQGRC